MSIEESQIVVRGLPIKVVRKNIKHLHLAVYPPDGAVRVSVPQRVDDELVRLAVVSRLGWIRRKRAAFKEQVRQSRRDMVSGESHFVQGRRYRLRVVEEDDRPAVRIANGDTLELRVRPGAGREKREAVLDEWHRQRLRDEIPALIAKWEPVIGVEVAEWGIRKMKTRWGSCNVDAGRIWVNLELAKKPPLCLEYLVVHEMVHLLERCHNDRFKAYMDRFMPQWRTHRATLNQMPLRHEDWSY
jgi:predicted metal-dependent hydrolase